MATKTTSQDVYEQLEQTVLQDYAAIAGKYIRVTYLKGYAENGDTIECAFDAPGVVVRVDVGAAEHGDLLRRMDKEWIDPCWPVTPMEDCQEMAGGHGWEIYGHSYSAKGSTPEMTEYAPVTIWEKIKIQLQKAGAKC
jgi:hypothetical protein